MKTANLYRFITTLAVLPLFLIGTAFPLGLGEISVKGSPDGLLLAEIPLLLGPGESGAKATIGNNADYGMMKLRRPDFLDSLAVSIAESKEGERRKIVVTSNKTLHIPSFDLVIKVTAGDGTIIEKFFLALDFRKSLSLELPEPKASAKPHVEVDVTGEAPIETVRETKIISTSNLFDEPGTVTKEEPPTTPKTDEAPGSTTSTGEIYLTIRSGDTLYGIVYRINIPKNLAYGAVIALHEKNPKAFIRGDIHRLKAGKRIYYGGIETLARNYSGKEMPESIAKSGFEMYGSSRPGPFTMLLPAAELIPADDIAAFATGWKEDWVSGGSEKLSENYSSDFLDSKGRGKEQFLMGRFAFNSKNENMKIDFENLSILRTGRYATVYFTQWFRSDTYASVGLKKLMVEKTPQGLKIVDEEFRSKRNATQRHPWVVYIAYAEDIGRAKEIISSLRGAGYEPFEARSFLTPGKGYRILVGRSGTRTQAEKISAGLKENGKNRAKVLEFPFSLEAGVFAGRGKADSARKRLLEKGFSPYLVESVIDGEMKYGIYIGAYASEAGAGTAMKTINDKEFSLKISKP